MDVPTSRFRDRDASSAVLEALTFWYSCAATHNLLLDTTKDADMSPVVSEPCSEPCADDRRRGQRGTPPPSGRKCLDSPRGDEPWIAPEEMLSVLCSMQRRDCQDMLTVYGQEFKPMTRFATDTSDLADLAVRLAPRLAVCCIHDEEQGAVRGKARLCPHGGHHRSCSNQAGKNLCTVSLMPTLKRRSCATQR